MFIIAFDFDGTLFGWVERGWTGPKPAGSPNRALINIAKKLRKNGHKIILWTCRETEDLEIAVAACGMFGLMFDAVNKNLPETIANYCDSRKIVADLYVDDRGLNPKAADILLRALTTKADA